MEQLRTVKASYHVGLVQSLFSIVQLFLKESLLLAEQLLYQYTRNYYIENKQSQLNYGAK